jgi:ribosomal protein L37E
MKENNHKEDKLRASRVFSNRNESAGMCRQCGKHPPKVERKLCGICIQGAVERHRSARRKIKHLAIEYLGGSCSICGLKDPVEAIYDFHHKDPKVKDIGISVMRSWTWERVVIELDKCILVCSNCHRKIHYTQEL